jgi:branched-chain amino acid transport system substrate-binding protein
MRTHRTAIAIAAALSMVVAACSSTSTDQQSSASSEPSSQSSSSAPSSVSSSEPAASSSAASSETAAGEPTFTGEPLKIGFLDTMTGPNGNVGTLNLQGAQIAVDQWNAKGGVLGRKIELVVKDEELSPEKTVQHMRDFNSEGINLITGFTSSADVLAAKPLAEQNNMVIVTAGTTDTSLTTTQHSANVYEIAANIKMMNVAAAHLAEADWKDVKVWDGVNYDYLTGHNSWDEFTNMIKSGNSGAATGKVAFVPFTATQMTPFINSLLAGNPDPKTSGLYYFLFGGGAVQFAKQAMPLDMFKDYAVVAAVGGGEEFSAALGAEGPHVYFVHDYFYQGYDNPVNKQFIEDWSKLPQIDGLPLYGPHEWAYEGYTAMLAYLNAITDAGSTDSDAVKASLSKIEFDSPMGMVKFHPSNILEAPVTVWECQGDSAEKFGYKCFNTQSIPPSITLADAPTSF